YTEGKGDSLQHNPPYPLIAPAMPLTKKRWVKRKITIMGTSAMVAPAAIPVQSTMFSPRSAYNPTASVRESGLLSVSTNGSKNEFQVQMNCIMTTLPTIGLASGKATREKVWKKPQPSMIEASSSSLGIPAKKLANRRTKSTWPPPDSARMMPGKEFMSPRFLINWKIGIIENSNGMNMLAVSTPMINPLP